MAASTHTVRRMRTAERRRDVDAARGVGAARGVSDRTATSHDCSLSPPSFTLERMWNRFRTRWVDACSERCRDAQLTHGSKAARVPSAPCAPRLDAS